MSSQPLLPTQLKAKETVRRHWLSTLLIPVLLVTGVIWIAVKGEKRPKDDLGLANYYLKSSPVIDGHIDLPEYMRMLYHLNASDIDLNGPNWHFDIPNARKGHLGSFFWSIFTNCPSGDLANDTDFVTPYYGARDTLEQLDVAKNLIARYPNDFAYCRTADDVMAAIGNGKIASLFGLEGAHSLESSLGALRMFYELGVRYMTLTHACNNAVADSAGIFTKPPAVWGGLSPFGVEAVKEMNRLGMIIDLSHTGDEAALQALALTRAPVMMSHSDARALNDIPRNAADDVIDKIGKVGGVIMVNFYDKFLAPLDKQADIGTIADHIDYFGDRIGRKHVGIGSDFDGVESLPTGVENVSSYPYIFAELIRRGWKQDELAGLAGGNILRVLRGVEATAAKMKKQGKKPSYAIYEKRQDL